MSPGSRRLSPSPVSGLRRLAAVLGIVCLCGGVAVAQATAGHRHAGEQGHSSRRSCRHRSHGRCVRTRWHKPTAHVRKRLSASGTGSANPNPSPSSSSSPGAPFSPALTPAQPTPAAPTPETPAEPAPSTGPAHLQVSAKEFSFTLSHGSAPAGRIVLELVNDGEDEHNLHIRPAAGGPDVGALPTLQAGHHEDQEFNLPAGTYTFYCSMPGHEALGMKATFTVQ
jgi:plastocyanin